MDMRQQLADTCYEIHDLAVDMQEEVEQWEKPEDRRMDSDAPTWTLLLLADELEISSGDLEVLETMRRITNLCKALKVFGEQAREHAPATKALRVRKWTKRRRKDLVALHTELLANYHEVGEIAEGGKLS